VGHSSFAYCRRVTRAAHSSFPLAFRLLPPANECRREPVPASELAVALQCGGSDAWSGVTANPALGYATDLLVAQGGTAVLGETPEVYGGEHLLTRRAVSEEVGRKLIERIEWWERYTAMNGAEIDNNPTPGNKVGGLTTILEKSLGAVAKSGSTPMTDVLGYAESVRTCGFVHMDTPGFDPVSVTGQVAGGCNLVVFTTGRGSVFGCRPAPTIKVATTSELYTHMPNDMDVNAGRILHGTTVPEVGEEIFELLLAVASGDMTRSERHGIGEEEFNPWILGQYMHTMSGAVVTGSFAMAGLGAYYLLAKQHIDYGRMFVTLGVIAGFIASGIQLFPSGDLEGLQVTANQPVKLAAMEGLFQTERGAGIVILGQPDSTTGRLDNPIIVPNVLSFLTYRQWTAQVKGLDAFPPNQRPDAIELLYYSYHIMVGLGTIFIAVLGAAAFLLWRKRLFRSRWMLWILMLSGPFPFIANTAGWMTAELGRQPWVVHGLMRTAQGFSHTVSAGNGLFTLLGFMGMYTVLGILFLLLIAREIGHGPQLVVELVEVAVDEQVDVGAFGLRASERIHRRKIADHRQPKRA